MAPMTRPARRAALEHIITVVLGQEPDGVLLDAIREHNISSPADLCNLSHEDISQLWFHDEEGREQPLPKGTANLIRIFKHFKAWRISEGNPISDEEWGELTEDEFTNYRFSDDCERRIEGIMTPKNDASTGSKSGNGPPSNNNGLLHEFRKGIKRDPTLFPKLTDPKHWDAWNRAAKAQARAQLVYEVFDPTYVPLTDESKALFEEKKKYVYAVFERCLLHIKGKSLVREYDTSYDAHALYAKLLDYHTKSTSASLESSALLAYITNVKVDDGQWKGSAESFILHWHDQLRKYESLRPNTNALSDDMKRTILENAVHPIEELRIVKTQAEQHTIQKGTTLTYDQYFDLLTSAAQAYDRQLTTRHQTRHTRRILEHDIYQDADDMHSDYEFSVYDAYALHQASQGSRPLSFSQWQQLGPDGQRIWDMLSPEQKSIILSPRSQPTPRPDSRQDHGRRPPSKNPPTAHISVHDSTLTTHPVIDADSTMPPSLPTSIAAHLSHQDPPHPAEPAQMLSQPPNIPSPDVIINGHRYQRSVNCTYTTYDVSKANSRDIGALIDQGANGGIAGADVHVLATTRRIVNVRGIDNHELTDVPIVTCAGVIDTNHGLVIAVMHNYAYTGKGRTIHSAIQLESFGNDVNDRPASLPRGLQRIITLEQYVIPLSVHQGLPYMSLRPFTNDEWRSLPHIILTGELDWDPSIVDGEYPLDTVAPPLLPDHHPFDAFGDFIPHRSPTLLSHQRILSAQPPQPGIYLKQFAWLPLDIISKTFACTTQLAHLPMSNVLRKTFQSPNPALNVLRRREAIATDTFFSDTPSIDGGERLAQIYVGVESEVIDIYGIKTEQQFTRTLEDNIRHRGAPIKLISDSAASETSAKVKDILRTYAIKDWQSEPHHQHQNRAERKYQDLKRTVNTVMDRTGAPPYTWLLAFMYVAFLLNCTATPSLGNRTPLEALDGITPDISMILRFHFYEPVYFRVHEPGFPSQTREARGRFAGFSKNVGHAMTFKILADETHRVIHRSEVRSALIGDQQNLRADEDAGVPLIDPKPPDVKKQDTADGHTPSPMIKIQPNDITGKTFEFTSPDTQERHQAQVIKAVEDYQQDLEDNDERRQYLLSVDKDSYEDVMSYAEIMAYIESGDDRVWKYKDILAHEGPLTKTHKDYKGSRWNLVIEWENGEQTSEPLTVIAKDDPVSVALYAGDNGLLDTPGWTRFKTIYRKHKRMIRKASLARLRAFKCTPKFMYGVEIPRDYQHALALDKANGNTYWEDATRLELQQLMEYCTFDDLGKGTPPPSTLFKRIRVHLIYAVKHDGRHKARLVADGHLTDIPVDSVYSGVVSL